MDLQPRYESIVGKKEFMRSNTGIEFKTGGGTLDVSKFSGVEQDGIIKAGTAVGLNDEGYYVPFDEGGEEGTDLTGAGLTASDIVNNGGNQVVGIVIAGHPLEDKCTNVTEAFKEAVAGYLRFDA